MMGILLNASKTKISNNSHRIAIVKVEKIIDEVIVKNQKNLKISFIDLGWILEDLRIFRQIFSDNKTSNETNNQKNKYQSYKDIKLELKNVKEREKRKKKRS